MTHTLKVGCYGAKGSYTYEAMEQQFAGKEREESYFPLFEDVVKAVKDGTYGSTNPAALASRPAARLSGLSVHAENNYINQSNYTRFFIIGPKMEITEDADKITLVISVKHEPGALYHVLGYFFYGGMNMTHLESRPMEGHPFEYFFHIDVKGRIHDPSNAQTLHGLASMCTYFKILGNYPSCKK